MNKTTYDECIERVCIYIQKNLNEELTLEGMSDVAAFSKYHFHRIFLAFTGMTVTKFIQMERLKRASYQLAFVNEKRVTDIAFDAGFESPEAFARAFKRTFDQSPSNFRAAPQWPNWHKRFNVYKQPSGEKQMNVKIVTFIAEPVAILEHLGLPENVLETAAKFIGWRKETGLSPLATSKTYGVPYSDPKTTEPHKFRWDICGSFVGEVPTNKYGVKSGVIPGGRCAVVRHEGSLDTVESSIYFVYRDWLPNSGEKIRDYPCFFHYINFIHEVDECDLITDIYIPIK